MIQLIFVKEKTRFCGFHNTFNQFEIRKIQFFSYKKLVVTPSTELVLERKKKHNEFIIYLIKKKKKNRGKKEQTNYRRL